MNLIDIPGEMSVYGGGCGVNGGNGAPQPGMGILAMMASIGAVPGASISSVSSQPIGKYFVETSLQKVLES